VTTPNSPIPPRRDPVVEFERREATKARTLVIVRWLFVLALCAGAIYCGHATTDVASGRTTPWEGYVMAAVIFGIAWYFFLRPKKP
jgi:hypothetical protein